VLAEVGVRVSELRTPTRPASFPTCRLM